MSILYSCLNDQSFRTQPNNLAIRRVRDHARAFQACTMGFNTQGRAPWFAEIARTSGSVQPINSSHTIFWKMSVVWNKKKYKIKLNFINN